MTTHADSGFMEQALRIAFERMGTTSPNPSVGAVIVREGSVISSGGTCACGCDHAEVDAIKRAAGPLGGAELYVTLEPCCHFGKTPPCTEAIIQSGIKKVHVPILDPNPLVAGKGVARLREAGIDVVMTTETARDAADLLRPFSKYIMRQKPFILHKAAVSLDGKIATADGDSKWISSDYSRYIVHRLRSHVDAIIIGRNTMIKDNPTLNIRLDDFPDQVKRYFEKTEFQMSGRPNYFMKMLLKSGTTAAGAPPLRVIIGLPGRLDKSRNIFFDENVLFFVEKNERNTFNNRKDYSLVKKLDDSGRILDLEGGSYPGFADHVMSTLYGKGIMFAMIEGGGTVSGSFLDAGAIDQFLYFITPRVIGRGLSPAEGSGAESISHSLRLHDVSAVMIDEDIMYTGYSNTID